jgi:hypothetical protein
MESALASRAEPRGRGRLSDEPEWMQCTAKPDRDNINVTPNSMAAPF